MGGRRTAGRRALARALLVGALALGAGAAAAAPPAGPAVAQDSARRPLSAQERARLAQGRLVVRSETVRRNGRAYLGGTSWQRIRLPPEAVWRAAVDVPRYHRLLPEVTEARVVRRRGTEQRLVYVRHARGPVSIQYHLWFTVEPGARVARFRVDGTRRGDIRSGWGFLAVYPYKGGETVLSYGIQADIGRGLFQALVRDSVHEWMLRVPQTMKKYVEGSGRHRYLRNLAATSRDG